MITLYFGVKVSKNT